jgi:hypothetical protein
MPKRKEIIILLNELQLAWNKKDLNEVAFLLDKEVISISPEVKIGVIPIKAKSLNGMHHVLKFMKELWDQFDTSIDSYDVINITQNDNEIVAELLVHHPVLGITDVNDIYFNHELKITKFDHKKITKYRSVQQKAPLVRLILKSLSKKLSSTFTPTKTPNKTLSYS